MKCRGKSRECSWLGKESEGVNLNWIDDVSIDAIRFGPKTVGGSLWRGSRFSNVL